MGLAHRKSIPKKQEIERLGEIIQTNGTHKPQSFHMTLFQGFLRFYILHKGEVEKKNYDEE